MISGDVFEWNDFETIEIFPDFRRCQTVTDVLKRASPRFTIAQAIRTMEYRCGSIATQIASLVVSHGTPFSSASQNYKFALAFPTKRWVRL